MVVDTRESNDSRAWRPGQVEIQCDISLMISLGPMSTCPLGLLPNDYVDNYKDSVFFPFVTNPTTKLFCLCHKIKTHSHSHNDLPSKVATMIRLAHDHVYKLSEVDNNGICFAALVGKRIILGSLSLCNVFLYFKYLFYI